MGDFGGIVVLNDDARARILTAGTILLVVLSLFFSIVRVTVTQSGSYYGMTTTVGASAYGPQARSDDLSFSMEPSDFDGVTARASWFSEATDEAANELGKAGANVGGDLGWARVGMVLTFLPVFALLGVGLLLAGGLPTHGKEHLLGWLGLMAGASLIVGFIVLLLAMLGMSSEFGDLAQRSSDSSSTVKVSPGPGAAAFLQPLAAGAAIWMGLLWRRAGRAVQPAASVGPSWPQVRQYPAAGETVVPFTPAAPAAPVQPKPARPKVAPAPPAAGTRVPAPKRPQGPAK